MFILWWLIYFDFTVTSREEWNNCLEKKLFVIVRCNNGERMLINLRDKTTFLCTPYKEFYLLGRNNSFSKVQNIVTAICTTFLVFQSFSTSHFHFLLLNLFSRIWRCKSFTVLYLCSARVKLVVKNNSLIRKGIILIKIKTNFVSDTKCIRHRFLVHTG